MGMCVRVFEGDENMTGSTIGHMQEINIDPVNSLIDVHIFKRMVEVFLSSVPPDPIGDARGGI